MAANKKVLAAGLVRDLWFSSMDHWNAYLKKLDYQKMRYQVLDTFERDDGSVIIRLLVGYNGSPLIQLFDE